jgi:chloramphenicol 3-O phosphotransferase
MASVILLNGGSSAGKSTLARALQEASPTLLLHVGEDDMISILPSKYIGLGDGALAGDGIRYEPAGQPGEWRNHWGETGLRVMAAVHRLWGELADAGFDLVIDHILDNRRSVAELAQALRAHRVLFVGVAADPGELDRREAARGDRRPGLARGTAAAALAHGVPYDLSLDSGRRSTAELTAAIFAARDSLVAEQSALRRLLG